MALKFLLVAAGMFLFAHAHTSRTTWLLPRNAIVPDGQESWDQLKARYR